MSLNTNGIKSNYGYLNKMVKEYDIIVLQETMSIKTKTIKEAFKENGRLKFFNKKAQKTKIKGRGSGGLSFIVNSKLEVKVNYPSDRIGILKIGNLALMNVYMPYFKNGDYDQMELFKKEVKSIVKWYEDLRRNNFNVIIVGDFNTDNYNQENKNGYYELFMELLSKTKLSCVDTELSKNINYTFKTAQTWLDHVLTHESMFENIHVRIKEDYSSKSDHFPVLIDTSYENCTVIKTMEKRELDNTSKDILENLASCIKIQNLIQKEFAAVRENISSQLNSSQNSQININLSMRIFYKLINDSVQAVNKNSNENKKGKFRKSNAWWSDRAQALHDEKDYLSQIKNKNKSIEKRITVIKRQLDGIRNDWEKRGVREKLVRQNINFKHCKTNFWKQLTKNQQDDSGVDLTADELKCEFSKLFNLKLVNNGCDDIQLQNEIKTHADRQKTLPRTRIMINELDVRDIVLNLPNNKASGPAGLNNEVLKMCCRMSVSGTNNTETNMDMIRLMTQLIQYMVDNKVFPNRFNTSVMYALIKDSTKSTSDMNNIRGISVSDVLTNIFEKIMLKKINEACPTNSKQFGFSKNSSCGHAVFVLKETMQLVKLRKKKMFVTAIDASKAFDKVNRYLLWLILIKKIGFELTNVLMAYYDISQAYVSNKEEFSDIFRTTIGVKQGGPLSPRLFSIYIQDLEVVIDSTNIGIKVGDMVINLLLYADDILLISETKRDMQHLIDIVEEFGQLREIKFNPNKTNYIAINEYTNIRSAKYINDNRFIRMGGEIIDVVSSLKYLGSYLSNNLLNKEHLKERYRLTAAAVKNLSENSGFHNKNVNVKVKLQLYKSYIRPVLTYGLETMILGSNEMEKLQSKEESIIKIALGLSPRLHSTELMAVLGLNRLDMRLDSLLPSFFGRLLENRYTNEFINQLKILNLPRRSIVNQMYKKFKTKDETKLKNICKIYKNIIDKNFKYEQDEVLSTSLLPELLLDINHNMDQIFEIMRAF